VYPSSLPPASTMPGLHRPRLVIVARRLASREHPHPVARYGLALDDIRTGYDTASLVAVASRAAPAAVVSGSQSRLTGGAGAILICDSRRG
jgi:hypothetical protein